MTTSPTQTRFYIECYNQPGFFLLDYVKRTGDSTFTENLVSAMSFASSVEAAYLARKVNGTVVELEKPTLKLKGMDWENRIDDTAQGYGLSHPDYIG